MGVTEGCTCRYRTVVDLQGNIKGQRTLNINCPLHNVEQYLTDIVVSAPMQNPPTPTQRHGYTSHGQECCSALVLTAVRPFRVSCGGLALGCMTCVGDADSLHFPNLTQKELQDKFQQLQARVETEAKVQQTAAAIQQGEPDLDVIASEWLAECGGCLGVSNMTCTCPTGDPRPVIMNLIAEIRRLRESAAVNVHQAIAHQLKKVKSQ